MELKRVQHVVRYYVWLGTMTNDADAQEMAEMLNDLRELVRTYNGTFDLFDMQCGYHTVSKIELGFDNFENLTEFMVEAHEHDVLLEKYSITDREAIRWSHGR